MGMCVLSKPGSMLQSLHVWMPLSVVVGVRPYFVDEAIAGRVAICQDFDVKALPRKRWKILWRVVLCLPPSILLQDLQDRQQYISELLLLAFLSLSSTAHQPTQTLALRMLAILHRCGCMGMNGKLQGTPAH